MKINVIGLGYIGLPTAAMFADHGVEVMGVDVKGYVVDRINNGQIHIEEPGLAEVVSRVVKIGNLRASLKAEAADAHIISVPTPNNKDEYLSCDLTYVIDAVKSIIPIVKKGDLIIVESTIAPRTMDDHVAPLFIKAGFKIGKDIFLAHCPERVLPGQMLRELVDNNRIVGGITPKCTQKASKLYQIFVKGEIIKTEAKTAEMSKLMENTFRDVNIALANELAKVCNNLGISVLDAIKMANKHPRVNILTPGPGVGGHCLAVDPYFIYAKDPETARLIKLARDINVSMPHYVVENAEKLLKNNKNSKIAVLGATYKANVDDVRESPALEIIKLLKKDGYGVCVHDPHVKNAGFVSLIDALKGASLVLVLVDHDEFKNLDLVLVKKISNNAKIFDVRGMIKEDDSVRVINYGNLYKNR